MTSRVSGVLGALTGEAAPGETEEADDVAQTEEPSYEAAGAQADSAARQQHVLSYEAEAAEADSVAGQEHVLSYEAEAAEADSAARREHVLSYEAEAAEADSAARREHVLSYEAEAAEVDSVARQQHVLSYEAEAAEVDSVARQQHVLSYEAEAAEVDSAARREHVLSYEAEAAEAAAAGSDTGGVPVDTAPAQVTPPVETPLPAGPLDEACLAAVELARAAAVDEGGPTVGDHLEAQGEPDPGAALVTHLFATTDRAYAGWRWAVTVVRAQGSDVVTVDEVVLLPGPDALLPPAWVPYSERVQPGDLSPGDVLPPAPDDLRLVPSHADPESDDDAALLDEAFLELGLGRARVLSREGRDDAAERWWNGEAGPHSPLAKAAPADCGSCGFLIPLGGSLRAAFGACANAFAPDDGRVVALTHGCGAHSEVPYELTHVAQSGMAVEHEELEVEPVHQPMPGDPSDEGLSEDESESLGHS